MHLKRVHFHDFVFNTFKYTFLKAFKQGQSTGVATVEKALPPKIYPSIKYKYKKCFLYLILAVAL